MSIHLHTLTYAGHSALLLQGAEGWTMAIDPWLLDNPTCPASLHTPPRLDLIVLTHGHSDHAGDAVRLAKTCGALIVAPYELAMLLMRHGVPSQQLRPMNKGGHLQVQGLDLFLTHAQHSSSYDMPDGPHYAGEACGVVVRDGSTCLFHAGDTCLFSDLQLIQRLYRPQIACLPIDGTFNMGPAEAALAAEWLGVQHVLPIHHSTFPQLKGTPQQLQEALMPSITCLSMEPGASCQLPL